MKANKMYGEIFIDIKQKTRIWKVEVKIQIEDQTKSSRKR